MPHTTANIHKFPRETVRKKCVCAKGERENVECTLASRPNALGMSINGCGNDEHPPDDIKPPITCAVIK